MGFYEILELPLDLKVDGDGMEMNYDPFIFKLVDEGSRQVIESFALPSTCLSVLHQYDFHLIFGDEAKSKINLECCLWFNPNRESMLKILEHHNYSEMIMAEIGLDEIRGFDENGRYSVFIELWDKELSLSKMKCDKIKVDFNNSVAENNKLWITMQQNELIDMQKMLVKF